MDYTPIIEKIRYWRDDDGVGDEFRRTHDLDCILTGGNLFADLIFSPWLPLRYTLNFFESPAWSEWKNKEYKQKFRLKEYKPFLTELERDIENFLPECELTALLCRLFELGQERCNVMILPNRSWNRRRGCAPYWDYLPHYLYDVLTEDNTGAVAEWIRRENLAIFFQDEIIKKENLLDLAGTGNVRKHAPRDIVVPTLINNYVNLLQLRENAMNLPA